MGELVVNGEALKTNEINIFSDFILLVKLSAVSTFRTSKKLAPGLILL